MKLGDARVWKNGECLGVHLSPDELAEALLDEGTIVWADLLDPSTDDLRTLAGQLGIGETAVEDALAPHERAKVTRHDTHLFFTVYNTVLDGETTSARDESDDASVESVHGRLQISRVSGFVLPRGFVTIRLTQPGHPVFDMTPVLRRWEESPGLLREGSGALVHGLLDVVVDQHFETIQELDESMEHLEDVLFAEKRTGAEFVRETYGIRKDLVALRRVVLPMREVVNALLRHRGRTGGALDAWYDDLYDHVLRAAEWTESLRDMVSTVFETNLSLQDARLNTIMKQLAAWAAIIAVPTAVTGWFGQNIPYPGFQNVEGLWLSVLAIVVLSGSLYAVFRKNDWL